MLDEAKIEALRVKYGKIGTVDFDGHQMVFRKPSRFEVREYRRKEDVASEKPDRVDQLAQFTIVSFDGNEDPVACRQAFSTFLDEYPMFCDSPKLQTVLLILSGGQEAEHSSLLGKGCSVRSAAKKTSPTASEAG